MNLSRFQRLPHYVLQSSVLKWQSTDAATFERMEVSWKATGGLLQPFGVGGFSCSNQRSFRIYHFILHTIKITLHSGACLSFLGEDSS